MTRMPGPIAIQTNGPLVGTTVAFSKGGMRYVTAIMKATFAMIHEGQAALVGPAPIQTSDALILGLGTLERASELSPFVPQVDVTVRGHARALFGELVPAVATRLVVYRERPLLDKTVHVYGDRDEDGGYPREFSAIPLVYELAKGTAQNPLGLSDEDVPNIVLPKDKRGTAGFAPIPASWPSRRSLAGEERMVLADGVLELGDDFPFSFFQSSPSDQRLDVLRGDEWIILDGMHQEIGRFATKLPGAAVRAELRRRGGRSSQFDLSCDTVSIDADDRTISLVWRGHLPLPSDSLDAYSVVASIEVIDSLGAHETTAPTPTASSLDEALSQLEESSPTDEATPSFTADEATREGRRLSPRTDPPPPAPGAFGHLPFAKPPAAPVFGRAPEPRAANVVAQPRPVEGLPFRASSGASSSSGPLPADSGSARPVRATHRMMVDAPSTTSWHDQDTPRESEIAATAVANLPFRTSEASVRPPSPPEVRGEPRRSGAMPPPPPLSSAPQPPSVQPPSLQPPAIQSSLAIEPPSPQPSLQPAVVQPPSLRPAVAQPAVAHPAAVQPPSLQPAPVQLSSLEPVATAPAVPPPHTDVGGTTPSTGDTSPIVPPSLASFRSTPMPLPVVPPQSPPSTPPEVATPERVGPGRSESSHPAITQPMPALSPPSAPQTGNSSTVVSSDVAVSSASGIQEPPRVGSMTLSRGGEVGRTPRASSPSTGATVSESPARDPSTAHLARESSVLSGSAPAPLASSVVATVVEVGSSIDAVRPADFAEAPPDAVELPVPGDAPVATAKALPPAIEETGVRGVVVAKLARREAFYDANFSGADLSGIDFTDAVLSGINLAGAKLVGCCFARARLTGAKLMGADLRDATLTGADLTQADLSRASLDRARFDGATLTDSNLTLAVAQGAVFVDATGPRATFAQGQWEASTFCRATLTSADFSGAEISRADFEGASLASARFSDARGVDSKFVGGDLDQATFTGATLRGVVFDGASMKSSSWERATLEGCSFRRAKMERAVIARATIGKAIFAEAELDGANFIGALGDGVDFSGAKLVAADLRQTKLGDVGFERSDLSKVNAHKAVLASPRFTDANLTGASFRAAKMKGATFAGAELSETDLRDADLENAKLAGAKNRAAAKLGGANLRGAEEDAKTTADE